MPRSHERKATPNALTRFSSSMREMYTPLEYKRPKTASKIQLAGTGPIQRHVRSDMPEGMAFRGWHLCEGRIGVMALLDGSEE